MLEVEVESPRSDEVEEEPKGIYREKFRKLVNRVVMFNIWQNIASHDFPTARNLDVKLRLTGPRTFLIKKNLREHLADVIYYNCYGKGRTVIKEGHEATGLYFLITGEITVFKKLWDNEKLTLRNQPIQAISSGEMFGEVGLLFDMERLVTCETATTCELFFVSRQDFEVHLRGILQEQWNQKKEILDRPIFREYFQNFSQKQLREACVLSKLHRYERDEIVFSENSGLKSFVYLLLSGQCAIIQCLKVDHTRKKPKLIPLEMNERRKSENILDKLKELQLKKSSGGEEDHNHQSEDEEEDATESNNNSIKAARHEYFVFVGSYKNGAIFGLGEEMTHRSVVARKYTECLLLPRYWLMQKEQNIGNIWSRTKIYLNLTLPSREATFDEFLRKRRWKRFKEDRMREYVGRKSEHQVTARLRDVPVLCRIENGL
ncbi:uncharacterized protein LOC129792355 [Lutzomyia longipalpis]|uniref:uncharacterized protein LOC129792355 n=1 Tax=Lutzomyia longipalpis TaxID=7200 RepID=UPI002483535D|nr:uncharacterized protein LOC129792355 [Lutzomyia longipalpis]